MFALLPLYVRNIHMRGQQVIGERCPCLLRATVLRKNRLIRCVGKLAECANLSKDLAKFRVEDSAGRILDTK